MAYKIVWTLIANEDFEHIIHYLSERWKPEKAIDFVKIFYHKLDLLEKMPLIGIKSEKRKNVRRLLITRYNYLIYSVIDDEIILLAIHDTRQNSPQIDF